MKTISLSAILLLTSLFGVGQTKDGLVLVNAKQKKIFCNNGQSANVAWYTIVEKTTDTAMQKTFIIDKSKISSVIDSLQKNDFTPKFKLQNVSDAKLGLKILSRQFNRLDTISKEGAKPVVDSIWTIKVEMNISSQKEKLNKTRIYTPKYTSLNRAKLEEKIKKYKEFSLKKYADVGLYEFEINFIKLFGLNPKSFFFNFESNEKEFF